MVADGATSQFKSFVLALIMMLLLFIVLAMLYGRIGVFRNTAVPPEVEDDEDLEVQAQMRQLTTAEETRLDTIRAQRARERAKRKLPEPLTMVEMVAVHAPFALYFGWVLVHVLLAIAHLLKARPCPRSLGSALTLRASRRLAARRVGHVGLHRPSLGRDWHALLGLGGFGLSGPAW